MLLQDAEEDEPLEDVVVDKGLQVLAELAQAAAKALNARPGDKGRGFIAVPRCWYHILHNGLDSDTEQNVR